MALSDYLIRESGGERGDWRSKEGELRYSIPHDDVTGVRDEFLPDLTTTTLTANFTYVPATDILEASTAVFTSAMVGRLITVTGKTAQSILEYTDTTHVVVSHQSQAYTAVATATVGGYKIFPLDTSLTGLDAFFARRLKGYDLIRDHPGHPGYSLVRNIYRTPTWDEIVQDEPERATLELDFSAEPTEIEREPAGQRRLIVGPSTESTTYGDDGSSEADWRGKPYQSRVARGSNIGYLPRCLMYVKTAAQTVELDTYYDLMGKSNSDTTLSTLAVSRANTLLCLGVKIARELRVGALWLINYVFLYDPGYEVEEGSETTWHSGFTCMTKKYIQMVLQDVAYKLNATTKALESVDRAQHVLTWLPRFNDDENTEEERDLTRGETSFASLAAMLEWYQ